MHKEEEETVYTWKARGHGKGRYIKRKENRKSYDIEKRLKTEKTLLEWYFYLFNSHHF